MHFTQQEFDARLAATRARMEAEGLDVILCTNPANMNWLTGYDGWSFYVHQLVVVAGDLAQPVWIGRGIDANAARVTTWLDEANIHGYADDHVQSDTKHPMDFVAAFLSGKGHAAARIGVEMDAYYFSAACLESLRHNLPDATFRDTTRLVNWLRVVKSPRELDYMREAARIVEHTMRTGIDRVRPGVRQCDAAADIYRAQIGGTPEYGGDYTGLCPMLPTGIGTSTPHLTWTDEPFREGEATILELAGARHHYHCPMARTVHLGPPPDKLADAAAAVVEGIDRALEHIRPGVTAESVEEVWRKTVARYGIVKDSRMGYSTGVSYPPDWGEHTLSLRPGDRTELRENMTIHMIPGVWLDDWGVEISECLRVTETGCETFCDFPRKLFVREHG